LFSFASKLLRIGEKNVKNAYMQLAVFCTHGKKMLIEPETKEKVKTSRKQTISLYAMYIKTA